MATVPGSTKTYKTSIEEIVETTNNKPTTNDGDSASVARSDSAKETSAAFGRKGSNLLPSSSVRDTFSNYSNTKQLNGKMIAHRQSRR